MWSFQRAAIWVFGALSALCLLVAAYDSTAIPSSEGCVDPKGFVSCYKDAVSTAEECIQTVNATCPRSTQDECVQACYSSNIANEIGCWVQSCWNLGYTCEYQLLAIEYFQLNDLVQNAMVPFYPPPEDASSGACSCNLGYVYGNLSYINMNNACINAAGNGQDAADECSCCEFSFPVSNVLNACPDSDLSSFGIDHEIAHTQNLIGRSADSCAILENSPDTCAGGGYGFPYAVGKPVYNVLNLTDEPGTQPLSNNAGNGFTSFPGPYTLQLYPAYSSIISPRPFDKKAGAVTGTQELSGVSVTVAAGSAATSGGTTKGTSTGSSNDKTSASASVKSSATTSASATATKKGGVAATNISRLLLWGSLVVFVLHLLL